MQSSIESKLRYDIGQNDRIMNYVALRDWFMMLWIKFTAFSVVYSCSLVRAGPLVSDLLFSVILVSATRLASSMWMVSSLTSVRPLPSVWVLVSLGFAKE